MQSAVKNYIQTQVSTTTQGDLVIMLFDAALKFLHRAKEKIAEKNYAQKGILISKALDILSELQGSLNVKKGGDLAERLQKLYFFCSSRLLMANLKMDVEKIDEVVGILTGLREAFSEANGRVATKAVPSSATQAPRIGLSAASAMGRTHVGGSTSAVPMGALAPQAAAGRYAVSASAPRPGVSSAPAPAPAAPHPVQAPLSVVGVAAAALKAAVPTAPAPAAPAPRQADPAAPARTEVPVASATPFPAATPPPAQDAGADEATPPDTAAAQRPTVSPVRRAMAAYSQGRAGS